LLTNGFETRGLQNLLVNARWNITKVFSIAAAAEQGERSSTSEFFSSRDYLIEFNRVEPKFSIQPNVNFRATFTYEYLVKENTIGENGELSEQNNGGVELKYSSVRKGVVTAKFNLIRIDYNADVNTSIAYEMLEGLNIGTNYTWGVSLQRNLSNAIQLSLNYEGRRPEGLKPIHTGSVSARAFF
jgi:hypothetical protein